MSIVTRNNIAVAEDIKKKKSKKENKEVENRDTKELKNNLSTK